MPIPPHPTPLAQDPPEWWTHPIGFLSYDNDVPEALLEAARTVRCPFGVGLAWDTRRCLVAWEDK